MPKTISGIALPKLQLTDQDEFALRQLGAQLQREIVSQYEAFVFQAGQRVDSNRWKHVRSDGDMQAYRERKSALKRDLLHLEIHKRGYANSGHDAQRTSTRRERHPQATMAIEAQRRRVLVTGIRAGTVDDLMFGASFQDEESFRAIWETHTGKDAVEKNAVLAKMEGPSAEDPYRFVGVTWLLRTFPVPNSMMNQRDFLTFTDYHLSKLSNGERVGISVAHSIQHRDLAELREFDTVRATSSVLRVFRQIDAHRVEVYMTHFLDTKGCTPEAFTLSESLGYMLPSAGYFADESFRKKLRWMMRRRERPRFDSAMSDSIEPMSSGSNDQCELCSKTIGKIFHSSGTSCELCYKRVCSRCSVSQLLTTRATRSTGKKKTSKQSDFCVECILQAKSTSTLVVAQDELKRRSRSSVRTSTSSRNSSSRYTEHSHSSDEPRARVKTVLISGEY